MEHGTLPERLALFLCVAAAGCASDHRVSPWGSADRLSVGLYLAKPDLEGELARVDVELRAHGLHPTLAIPGKFAHGAGEFRLLGYAGRDPLGRAVHATRAVTAVGVPLALGPLDPGDLDRSHATELVAALAPGPDASRPLEGAAYRSGTDLTGDGSPDVVLKNDAGALEIWHLEPHGASRYEVELAVPPTGALDVDRDGRVDLTGKEMVPDGDLLAPTLDDVATFDGGRLTNRSPAARAHHEARLAAVEVAQAKLDEGEGAARARLAIERAWHALLAGRPADGVLHTLAQDQPKPPLRAPFDAWRKRVEAVVKERSRSAVP